MAKITFEHKNFTTQKDLTDMYDHLNRSKSEISQAKDHITNLAASATTDFVKNADHLIHSHEEKYKNLSMAYKILITLNLIQLGTFLYFFLRK